MSESPQHDDSSKSSLSTSIKPASDCGQAALALQNSSSLYSQYVYLFLAFGAYSIAIGYTGAVDSLLRQDGWTQTQLGLLALLALPWALKFLWAGWLDRTAPHPIFRGQHLQGWLVAMQLCQIAVFVVMAFWRPNWSQDIDWIGFLFFFLLLNITSASIEVAANGLAVRQKSLGFHRINVWQMAGYEFGRVLGGAGFLMVAGYASQSVNLVDDRAWMIAFLYLAALSTLNLLPKWWLSIHSGAGSPSDTTDALPIGERIRQGAVMLKAFWSRPHFLVWLGFLMAYKSSEIFGSSVYKPMLVDYGIRLQHIGGITVIGAVAAIFGAILAAWLVKQFSLITLLRVAYMVQGTGLLSYAVVYYLLAHHSGASLTVITVVEAYEQFCSALATTALLTALMGVSRPAHAAFDFSLQHSILIISAGSLRVFAGISVDTMGYRGFYALAMILFMVLAVWVWYSSRVYASIESSISQTPNKALSANWQ